MNTINPNGHPRFLTQGDWVDSRGPQHSPPTWPQHSSGQGNTAGPQIPQYPRRSHSTAALMAAKSSLENRLENPDLATFLTRGVRLNGSCRYHDSDQEGVSGTWMMKRPIDYRSIAKYMDVNPGGTAAEFLVDFVRENPLAFGYTPSGYSSMRHDPIPDAAIDSVVQTFTDDVQNAMDKYLELTSPSTPGAVPQGQAHPRQYSLPPTPPPSLHGSPRPASHSLPTQYSDSRPPLMRRASHQQPSHPAPGWYPPVGYQYRPPSANSPVMQPARQEAHGLPYSSQAMSPSPNPPVQQPAHENMGRRTPEPQLGFNRVYPGQQPPPVETSHLDTGRLSHTSHAAPNAHPPELSQSKMHPSVTGQGRRPLTNFDVFRTSVAASLVTHAGRKYVFHPEKFDDGFAVANNPFNSVGKNGYEYKGTGGLNGNGELAVRTRYRFAKQLARWITPKFIQ